ANLRRSHLRHLLRESRMLDRLDLSRGGGLFGGPYLWFNYITRLLVQETALLLLDYNRHAIPLDRLACSPEPVRERFRTGLASRLKVDPEEIWLPPAGGWRMVDGGRKEETPAPSSQPRLTPHHPPSTIHHPPKRPEADAFLETVEFTAVDFLADD